MYCCVVRSVGGKVAEIRQLYLVSQFWVLDQLKRSRSVNIPEKEREDPVGWKNAMTLAGSCLAVLLLLSLLQERGQRS